MKQKRNINVLFSVVALSVLLLTSCEESEFNYKILATHSDGIKNLDEEGIDCGGSSGIACPSCTDGKKNGDETGIDCGGINCPVCPESTPRADALKLLSLPYYYTFETGEAAAGKLLKPRTTNADGSIYNQGVSAFYGEHDPAGGNDAVTKIIRPQNGLFGGYEDFKFQTFAAPIDFSIYHKWTIKVYIPTNQNFAGPLNPQVDLIFHDDLDNNFYQRWTVISKTINEADLGKWVTLEFDGSNARAADTGKLLPQQNTYTNVTLVFGGSGHQETGTFYVKDFIPTTRNFDTSATPRADALATLGLPYFFTFESNEAGSVLKPFSKNADNSAYTQGVDLEYGIANPDGSPNSLVTKITRPNDNRFGGYEDFKFQTLAQTIDFSVYHKWSMDVYIPSGQNFTGPLKPEVVLILMDYNTNFYERWTEIPITISESDFGTWKTIIFDGTTAAAAGSGTLLPAQNTYTNISLRFGGSGHNQSAIFYVKDFKPIQ